MKRWATLLFLPASYLFAQDVEIEADTTVLDEIVVKAYQSNRPADEVPAAIAVVDPAVMTRFANTSFVSAVNTVPGVRMEERSPGSYRFSIRGSLLRSPFGVRNVKFYWRGLPFTDGGGNTYLNLLDFSSVDRMEIIKGPGSSLYGAGTGGAVLMDPVRYPNRENMRMTLLGGSYGLWQALGTAVLPFKHGNAIRLFAGLQGSQGYRDHTSMGRSNASIEYTHDDESSSLSFILFTGSIGYETPGGLNKTQWEQDPRQARPATPTIPGAVEQDANVSNNTTYAAVSHQSDWSEHWSSTVGVFASYTNFKNPAILNYETRGETNVGTRATVDYHFGNAFSHKLTFGAEAQYFKSIVLVSANNQGQQGALATRDILQSRSAFTFAQADFQLPYDFYFTAGVSGNFLKYDMEREIPVENFQTRNFKPGLFPRVALLKKFLNTFSLYATASDGFSAPTFAEVLPNTSVYNNNLNPERGISLETGLKGDFFSKQLHAEIALYDFKLKDAIVNVSGGDDFQNAGETSQKGIETMLSWKKSVGRSSVRLWGSYSYNNYFFVDYTRAGNDYSGNFLTGVPRHVIIGGLDISLNRGWYLNATSNHTEDIPLNDANTEFAEEYFLVGFRTGKIITWRHMNFNLFGGVDNLLDQDYSLGNDLNAAGGRYYNAAPDRNYYFGITFSPIFK